MPPDHDPSDQDPLSVARATVLNPQSVDLQPARIYDAWARLKEARGDGIARPALLAPAHLVRHHDTGQVVTENAAGRSDRARFAFAHFRSIMSRPIPGGGAA